MSEHIKTELEIIEIYLKWKEYIDKDEMPESIEPEVTKKANTKWVSLEWIQENIKKMLDELPLETSSDWLENATANESLKDILSLLKQEINDV